MTRKRRQLGAAFKAKVALAAVRGEKTNESCVLKNHLPELTARFPLLKLITGDAIYATRPLTAALLEQNCDYLLQIKGNQQDLQDAAVHCLSAAHERTPAAQTSEKRGTLSIVASCGLI